MKHLLIILATFFSFACLAQTNNDNAIAAYKKAFTEYSEKNYSACISNLQTAVTLLEKTNAKIQILMVKACFESGDYAMTKSEVQKYFDLQPAEDDDYARMRELSLQAGQIIDRQNAERAVLKAKEDARKAEEEAWSIAASSGNIGAYEQYLTIYSNSIHKTQANLELEKLLWNDAIGKNTLSAYQDYLKRFPKGINVKTAQEKMEMIIKSERIKSNPDSALAVSIKEFRVDDAVDCVLAGANPNISLKWESGSSKYETYLLQMVVNHDYDQSYNNLYLLFDHGADPNVYYMDGKCRVYVLEKLLETTFNEKSDYRWWNRNSISIISLFLRFGFNKSNFSNEYSNFLYALTTKKDYESRYDLIKFLLDNGADPYRGVGCNPKRDTPIQKARWGDDKVLELFELYKKYRK